MIGNALKWLFTMIVVALLPFLGKLWLYVIKLLKQLAKHAIKLIIKLLKEILNGLKGAA